MIYLDPKAACNDMLWLVCDAYHRVNWKFFSEKQTMCCWCCKSWAQFFHRYCESICLSWIKMRSVELSRSKFVSIGSRISATLDCTKVHVTQNSIMLPIKYTNKTRWNSHTSWLSGREILQTIESVISLFNSSHVRSFQFEDNHAILIKGQLDDVKNVIGCH